MKRLLVSTIMLFSVALAEDLAANSKISGVTVYSDRASVTRDAMVKAGPGTATVVFSKLPIGIDDRSVRASAGDAFVKILGIETRVNMGLKDPHQKIAE